MYGYQVFKSRPENFGGYLAQTLTIRILFLGNFSDRNPFYNGDCLLTLTYRAFSDMSGTWTAARPNYAVPETHNTSIIRRGALLAEKLDNSINDVWHPNLTETQGILSMLRACKIQFTERNKDLTYVVSDHIPDLKSDFM